MLATLQLMIVIAAISLILWLLSRPGTWVIICSFTILVSCIGFLASIIHFQILAALGFAVLGIISITVADAILGD